MSAVTVYIPTKNRLASLKRAVDSVLNQTMSDFELIVVNDNSTDGTGTWLDQWRRDDARVKALHFSKNRGTCAARNRAIHMASGEFITGLDDDDYFLPRRLEILLGQWDDRYCSVTSNDALVDENKIIKTRKPRLITYESIKFYNCVGNQLLTRKQYLIDIGGFDEKLRAAQDYDVWIRLIREFGPCKVAREVTMCIDRSDELPRISNSGQSKKLYSDFVEKHKIGSGGLGGALAFVLLTGDTRSAGQLEMLSWVLSWRIPWRAKRRLVKLTLANMGLYPG